MAGIAESKEIGDGDGEITFTGFVPAGKYDMEAILFDSEGRLFPAYYVFIEKL